MSDVLTDVGVSGSMLVNDFGFYWERIVDGHKSYSNFDGTFKEQFIQDLFHCLVLYKLSIIHRIQSRRRSPRVSARSLCAVANQRLN